MRKLLLLYLGIALSSSAMSQSFDDDFESYNVGSYLAQSSSTWTTWSGNAGGADDVQIVNDTAYSGSKSIYFEATSSGGGPDDVVLPFGAAYDNGLFEYSMMMLINSGAGAYFNFQAETTVGVTWTLECTINQSGDFVIGNTDGTMLTGNIDISSWMDVAFVIDLDINEWDFIVNGTSQGTFSNTVNQIASIDIFAYNGTNGGNGISQFWVDDVSFAYTSTSLPNLNGAVTAIASLNGIAGSNKKPSVTVKNLGNSNITAFDVEVDYNGTQTTENVTGVNLASYDEYTVDFANGVGLIAGSNTLTATIMNVNGQSSDDDNTDDSKDIVVDPVVPGLNKMVVVEEATGTWCGWCPRGAVWMARMQDNYPEHFIGIAVHNGDPMTNTDYDAGMGGLISGYPSCLVDRKQDVDPSAMEPDFLERVQLDASAALCHSAIYNSTTNELIVSLRVAPTSDLTSSWGVAMAMTESNVSGTSSQYAQANYYSGGASGTLSGAGHDWHLEPNPIPASQMKYDHVARMIYPTFDGMANSFPSGASAGDTVNFEFTVSLDASWNLDEMHLITMLIDPTGKFDNGYQTSLNDALAVTCVDAPSGVKDLTSISMEALSLYPNPASTLVNIKLNVQDENTMLTVRDMMGRIVYTTNIVDRIGLFELNLDLSKVHSGMYSVEAVSTSVSHYARFIKE